MNLRNSSRASPDLPYQPQFSLRSGANEDDATFGWDVVNISGFTQGFVIANQLNLLHGVVLSPWLVLGWRVVDCLPLTLPLVQSVFGILTVDEGLKIDTQSQALPEQLIQRASVCVDLCRYWNRFTRFLV